MTETPAPSQPIDVGQPAPPFSLPDQDGKTHTLADYAGRWIVLYFYPKDNTPGCTKQACGFRDAEADLEQAGLVVLGVSPDDVNSHRKFVDKFSLNFPLLADEGANVCQAYGVWGERRMFAVKYMGVSRTTYLIDPAGTVAHRWDKVKVDDHAADVLAKFTQLST